MIGGIGGIYDDALGLRHPFDQASNLRTVAPLAGCDCEPDRSAKRTDCNVGFGCQAVFGAANTGSFKPPTARQAVAYNR